MSPHSSQKAEAEMNEKVANSLRELIAQNGTDLASDWPRLRGLLNDYHPEYKREINVLVQAAQLHIPSHIVQASNASLVVLIPRLTQVLHEDAGIDERYAYWAVQTWCKALGIHV
ncbi:MAG: hypothetical protein MN733_19505, partial [Nitrososphaera sp.]|nr:hypothetical protein [Nitrososphaera sp.]